MTLYQAESELWQDFRNGSEKAFASIYEAYFTRLYNYGHQFCRDGEIIKDCLQNLFIDLRRNCRNLGEVGSLRNYLYAALRYRIVQELRSPQYRSAALSDQYSFQLVIPYEDYLVARQFSAEQKDSIERALRQLTRRQREVIFLRFYENLSYQEVASVMGLEDVKSARNLVSKAVCSLRQHLTYPALHVLLWLWQ
ncbi:MAG: sigma-70 family RNA polymerase sigma factor [Cytophagales bacterium]|nr:sigma-70 family RNA polymerase sigma factor [Cytophagales bacterium]